MFWIFVTGLWAAMLVSPFVLLYLFLPAGKECPRCSAKTISIQSRLLRPVRAAARLRWCMECGWEGVARVATVRNPLPKLEVVPDDRGESEEPWRQSLA